MRVTPFKVLSSNVYFTVDDSSEAVALLEGGKGPLVRPAGQMFYFSDYPVRRCPFCRKCKTHECPKFTIELAASKLRGTYDRT